MSQVPNDGNEHLLGQLGGPGGLQRIVDQMYVRVLADDDLASFFTGVAIDRLVRMQSEFMASMIDGTIHYTGADLTRVHQGRGITRNHFSKFCGHLTAAMEANNVPALAIDQVLSRLAMYSDKITGNTNVDG